MAVFGDAGERVTDIHSFLGGYIYALRFALSEDCTATSLATRINYHDANQYFRPPVALTAGNYFLGAWFGATSGKAHWGRGANSGSTYGGYAAVTYHPTNSPGNLSSWDALDVGATRIICNYTPASSGASVPVILAAQNGSTNDPAVTETGAHEDT